MEVEGTTTWEAEGLRVEGLIAELSTKFINLPSGEVDREIEDAQRRICDCLGLDMSSLWQWSADDPTNFKLTHLYRPLGGPPIPERMDASENFPWSLERMRSGKTILFSSLDELPPEAAGERELRRSLGIISSATFPLAVGGKTAVGAVTFNTSRERRTWPEQLVGQLRMVAQVFAHALARKQSDQLLRESEERLALAAESAGAGLWSLDLASGSLWATDMALELLGLPPGDTIDLDRFLSLIHPEDRDSVQHTIKELVESTEERKIEYRIRRSDGEERWISSRGRACRGLPEQPDRLMGVSVDVTERMQAEQAMRELSGRLIAAHEDERARLSRDLHDDVTQSRARLSATSLNPRGSGFSRGVASGVRAFHLAGIGIGAGDPQRNSGFGARRCGDMCLSGRPGGVAKRRPSRRIDECEGLGSGIEWRSPGCRSR
jgi:PAS domain S-box-containing protein